MRQVVATSLGFSPRQGVALAQGIAEYLGSRRLLIVLDNCEHLLDPVAETTDWNYAATAQTDKEIGVVTAGGIEPAATGDEPEVGSRSGDEGRRRGRRQPCLPR
jgi:predicted ATPase